MSPPGSTLIRPVSGRHWLAPASSTRCVVRPSCDVPSGRRFSERNGLTTFRRCNRSGEVGGVSSPVARRPRARSSEPRNLATYLFGRSLSASLACSRDGVYRHFTLSSPYPRSWPPTALRLAVVVSAHAFTTLTRGEEVTLSLELPTSPLPVTPVQVGDCWQNSR